MCLRLGVDLDGTVADLDGAIQRAAAQLFGVAPEERTPAEPSGSPNDMGAGAPASDAGAIAAPAADGSDDASGEQAADEEAAAALKETALTVRQQRVLWQALSRTENFWETLEELEAGSVARLARLAQGRRWEVLFITTRPPTAGATCQVQSQRWLQRHGFNLPSVFVVAGSRGKIAEALSLDFVVDDRPENCLDVVLESKASAILVWRGEQAGLPNSARRLGIGVVASVAECLDILSHVSEIGSRSSVMDRVKRLLGLGTAATP